MNPIKVFLLYSFLLVSLVGCNKLSQPQKPNILILFADDLGYADISCFGSAGQTPNLDLLAEEGATFSSYYAGAPNCSPSRVALLSGKIPSKTGMYNYRAPGSVMHLKAREVTMAEILKRNGYQTAHFGKWHLGCLPQDTLLNQPQPEDQGFDYSFGTENNASPSHLNPINFVRNGKKLGEQKGYSCDILARDIEKWFENEYMPADPFLLYVAFHEPHGPIASPPELVQKYKQFKDEYRKGNSGTTLAEYYANIHNMDLAIGNILSTLEKYNTRENTLIFFASDNGPVRNGSQGELRGLKGEIYDGGIKVPAILHYPALTGLKSQTISEPIWAADILPTICDLLDINTDNEMDGQSLMPLFKGEEIHRKQAFFWFFYRSSPEISLRKGDYGLIARSFDSVPRAHWITDIDMPFIKNFQPEFYELYNLIEDPAQQNDLSSEMPDKLKELQKEMNMLLDEVKTYGPYWEGLIQYKPQGPKHNKIKEFEENKKTYLKKNSLDNE